jgi:hypothetical protein
MGTWQVMSVFCGCMLVGTAQDTYSTSPTVRHARHMLCVALNIYCPCASAAVVGNNVLCNLQCTVHSSLQGHAMSSTVSTRSV